MKDRELPATGAILAGGKSRRMGRDKALLPLGGQPVIARLVQQFQSLFEDVFLVTNDPSAYRAYCRAAFRDVYPGQGPLAGIHSALRNTERDWIYVSACDTPFLIENVVREMARLRSEADAVVAETPDGIQPLNAFYSRSCRPAIEACLQQGDRKVVSFYASIRLRVVPSDRLADWDPEFLNFWNMNTPEDYETAQELFESRRNRAGAEGGAC